MNFLAHLYLGDYGPEESAGSVLADFIKGKRSDALPKGIERGIRLHLAIDDFTDHHPVFRASRSRLHQKFAHYAPVAADVFYDHFLAVSWNQYSDETLEAFTKRAFQNMKMHRHYFPLRLKHIFLYNRFQKLLLSYRTEKGVRYAFMRLSGRARFHSGLEQALDELEVNYQLYQKEFFEFFPEVQNFAKEFMKNKKHSS
jgi:acyl carrier protein phosphodiesterase